MASPADIPGGTALDGPPPSPALEQGVNPGLPLGDLMGGRGSAASVTADQFPPEVLAGVLSAGQSMSEAVDSFAQMMPNLAQDWAIVKAALQSALAKVQQAGAGPVSPMSPGPNFPGGGFSRAGSPLASGGI